MERLSAQEFRETLSAVANDTGGFLVRGTNELAAGLRRMLEDNDAYYLMAYEPTNTKRDGKFRKIEVRLPAARRTRGAHAQGLPRSRRSEASASGAPAGARPDSPAAAAAPSCSTRPRLARPWRPPSPRTACRCAWLVDYLDLPPAGSQVIVGAHVNLAGLDWQEADGRRRADLELVGGVYDANGGPVGPPFGKRFELDLTPAEQERALKDGAPVPEPAGRSARAASRSG